MSYRHSICAAALLGLSAPAAQAQGIPVIDVANLVQTIQQVMNDITEINNQVQQIQQLQSQLSSMNGQRLLGMVDNDLRLRNYVPANAFTFVNAIDSSGYSGLIETGKALRDQSMLYNCLDLEYGPRTHCQARLAQPYQQKGLLQDAMGAASRRLPQINALMARIDATADPKAVQEVQARISAENALLAHEASQVQLLQAMADSEERIARSRDRERQYEGLLRSGKISDYLR
jgi:type IV secretion system protein VirB5